MKRPHPHAAVLGQTLDPLPHLVGGLVGERQRQDLAGRDAVQQQVRDAVRDDPRLAAAGPRQNQQRPIDVRGRFTLRRRQRSQQVRRVGNGERAFHRGQGTTRKGVFKGIRVSVIGLLGIGGRELLPPPLAERADPSR